MGEPIQITMFKGNGPFAALVRKWTKSQYAHVGIVLPLGRHTLTLEARPLQGVAVEPFAARPGEELIDTGIPWTDDAWDRAILALGIRYSVLDAILAGLGKALRFPGFQCAELAAHVLGLPAGPWTPEGLKNHLQG